MFTGFNLPKNLLDASSKLLDEVNKQDAQFNQLLSEYGVTTPEELSEEKQDEFLAKGTELLGEKYVGFEKLKRKIAARGGVKNAAAVAAAIGRKKYGKEKFQKAAATDHKMRNEEEQWDTEANAHERMVKQKQNLANKLQKEASNEAPGIPHLDETNLDEGKWNYPKNMTSKPITVDDGGSTNQSKMKDQRKAWRKKIKAQAHKDLMTGKRVNEDHLDEGVSRKHFQQVADVIKAHPDQDKRNELAKHHAEIFKKQNPRFDHSRFYKAAGAQLPADHGKQTNEEAINEISKSTLNSYVKKATSQLSTAARLSGNEDERAMFGDNKEKARIMSDFHDSTATKRHNGIIKAADKLTKEEPVETMKQVKMVNQEERHLTTGEMNKRERVVKSLKKNIAGFKKRYGERAKSVMYAVATKQAKKD